jgi:sodium-dependent dicarboxylate transporter 2/3/5
VIVLTGLAWTFRPLISARWPGLSISDAGIAMTAALALFVIPDGTTEDEALLDWRDLAALRWDVLILFGGGLALAQALNSSGLAAWLGNGLRGLEGLPLPVLVLTTMFVIVYLGELASNTAVAAVFLPIAGAAAVGLGEPPASLTLPVALAASLGFMLPVATPPNAIVFGSGAVTARQMLRAGAILDVVTIPVVAAVALVLTPLVIAVR